MGRKRSRPYRYSTVVPGICIVWNVECLKSTAAVIPGHPFGTICLLSNAGVLAELKLLVTIENEGHMMVATGIPPHIGQAVFIKSTLKRKRKSVAR